MTGVVVASLTIINPYIFKIVNNFLIWLVRCVGLLVQAWKGTDSSESPSEQPGVDTPLLRRSSDHSQRSNAGKSNQASNAPIAQVNQSSADPNIQATLASDPTLNQSTSNQSTLNQASEQSRAHPSFLRPSSDDGQGSSATESNQAHDAPIAQVNQSSADPNIQATLASNPTSNEAAGEQNGQEHVPPGLQNGSTLASVFAGQRRCEYGTETISDVLGNSQDSRDAVWNLAKWSIDRLRRQSESPAVGLVVVTTILFGVFVAQVVASIFSAKIASDRAGLVSSEHCGIWQFDKNAGEEAADLDDLRNYQIEARASQYARTCYNAPDPQGPFSCRIFYNQSIKFDTKTHQTCPFASSELCSEGLYSTVTFDTGLIDASVIGINAPVTHKFRRTASCSPLNMSRPYVVSPGGANETDYYYYYGPKDNVEYTFNTSGHPFEWLVPVYSVK